MEAPNPPPPDPSPRRRRRRSNSFVPQRSDVRALSGRLAVLRLSKGCKTPLLYSTYVYRTYTYCSRYTLRTQTKGKRQYAARATSPGVVGRICKLFFALSAKNCATFALSRSARNRLCHVQDVKCGQTCVRTGTEAEAPLPPFIEPTKRASSVPHRDHPDI